jgi:hypothetical protein
VRFDSVTLASLRTLADIHDTSIAEEVRAAVRHYLESLQSDDSFRVAASEAIARRQRDIEQLLGKKR